MVVLCVRLCCAHTQTEARGLIVYAGNSVREKLNKGLGAFHFSSVAYQSSALQLFASLRLVFSRPEFFPT